MPSGTWGHLCVEDGKTLGQPVGLAVEQGKKVKPSSGRSRCPIRASYERQNSPIVEPFHSTAPNGETSGRSVS